MDEEFENFKSKSSETFEDILKKLDSRGSAAKLSPVKSSSSNSTIGNTSSTSTFAPLFNPDSSAKTSTQKTTRGRGAATRGRGRGRGASTATSDAANTTTTSTRKPSARSKMPSLIDTLGTASKTSRPQRQTTAKTGNTSKTIYISDSD